MVGTTTQTSMETVEIPERPPRRQASDDGLNRRRRYTFLERYGPDFAVLICAADALIGFTIVVYGLFIVLRGIGDGTIPAFPVLLCTSMGSLLLYSSSSRASRLAPTIIAALELATLFFVTFNSTAALTYLVQRQESLLLSENFVHLMQKKEVRVSVGLVVAVLAVLELWRSAGTCREANRVDEDNGLGRGWRLRERGGRRQELLSGSIGTNVDLEEPLLGQSSLDDITQEPR